LDWAHILSRRYLAVRWDWRNSTTLCRTDHQKFTRRPEEWVVLCQTKMGMLAWEQLYNRAMSFRGKTYLEPWFYAIQAGPGPTDKPW
jgi:hypothetical protein